MLARGRCWAPEAPTLPGGHEPGVAQGIDVAEVAGSTTLDEGHHLAGHQIRQAVDAHVGPGEGRGRLELGRALGDPSLESLPDDLEHALPVLGRYGRCPPGVDIVSRPIVQVVEKAESASQGDRISQPRVGEGLQRPFRRLGQMGRPKRLSHSDKDRRSRTSPCCGILNPAPRAWPLTRRSMVCKRTQRA